MSARLDELYLAPAALPGRLRVEHVRGVAEVLGRARELLPLVSGTSQQGELHDLAYFFSKPSRLRATPHLLLIYRKPPAATEPEELAGAVLVLTFSLLSFYPGLYFVQDRHGRRAIFGPLAHRVELAVAAVRALAEEGARYVNLDFDLQPEGEEDPGEAAFLRARALVALRLSADPVFGPFRWSMHRGARQFGMALYSEFEVSIAGLGKKNRNNLRRGMRLATHELGCVYVPEAKVGREAFLELARDSHYRPPAAVARWRYESMQRFPNTFLAGLQSSDGRWLSLLGGRRNGAGIEVDWQMNRKGFERYSLATTLRAFLIRHEGAAGSTSLFLEGGAFHKMLKYFRSREVYSLTLARGRMPLLAVLNVVLKRFWPLNQISTTLDRPWRKWLPARSPRS